MSTMYKHADQDKYDEYMPNKPGWIQDDYYTSGRRYNFHCPKAYAYFISRRGFFFGIQKKLHIASGSGINVDSRHVGKSSL